MRFLDNGTIKAVFDYLEIDELDFNNFLKNSKFKYRFEFANELRKFCENNSIKFNVEKYDSYMKNKTPEQFIEREIHTIQNILGYSKVNDNDEKKIIEQYLVDKVPYEDLIEWLENQLKDVPYNEDNFLEKINDFY
ncbi:hypothetical protein JXM83_02415 [Candidatus Woesearchaeota archaeon]|nr:hypothetical protein [Candidatus Woesearchaeota archaeon]